MWYTDMPANSKTKCDYDSQNGVMHPKWSNNMLTNAKCTYVRTYVYICTICGLLV